MKRFLLAFSVALAAVANAVEWKNVEEKDYIGGVQISSPEKLMNRVVLVDMWGVNCPPCRALLPKLQDLWTNFGLPADKPFIVLGSHRQGREDERIKALVKKAGVTYPVYQGAGIENEPPGDGGLPYMYVLNHRGKVIYKGRDFLQAQEKIVNAIGEVGRLPSLTDGVYFVNYKNMESQLVLGKPIKNLVKRLELDANSKDAQRAAEAKKILFAIKRGLANTKEEIDFQKDYNPREAVRLIKLMKVTWPEEAEAAYKAELPAIIAAAKKRKAQGK